LTILFPFYSFTVLYLPRACFAPLLPATRSPAVRDTEEELCDEFGHRRMEVIFFHVPETRMLAR
jgi:hypothetical protein